ncbi:Zn-dependent hydrolase [Salibacterium qingdaonense]|uniref:Allantoate deiminase n=1 Tax=Salibacterium qingdaonense TaxID=266892 RepID=A0A1I4NDR7_9BACI|nr:Zn-dependent hydrolase [Salibacterium qingdaonense]SFM13712.1 allantoate deiminase [Salibacterium qingdaonense]
MNIKKRLLETEPVCRDYLSLDPGILAQRLSEMAEIGKTQNSGVTRFVYTDEEAEAKALFRSWMEQAGLSVREDEVGNLYGRLEGTNPDMPAVLTGSHLDTVPEGGAFDGALGCISSLMAVEAVIEQEGRLTHPVEVAVFIDEEGARFGGGLLGSRIAMGEVTKEDLFQMKDDYDTTAAEAMKRSGYTPNKLNQCFLSPETIEAFLEVHVEQGKQLEQADSSVGIVNGIAGPSWLEITLKGETDHAGNTPMDMRRDAAAAAAEVMTAVEAVPDEISSTAVATVGKLTLSPNGSNVIAGRADLIVDIRDIEEDTRDEMIRRIEQVVLDIAEKRNVESETLLQVRIPPVPVPQWLQHRMETAAKTLELPYQYLPSGAGHDAMILGRYIPSGMIFVPSVEGRSHSPEEFTELKDCLDGTALLLETLKIAGN